MNIIDATTSFETWLAGHVDLVPDDLERKHRKMARAPFPFLRATFYRWLQVWPVVCSDLAGAPRVAAVGDLHLENFGTWRDLEGRLIWGVNDLDEACALPFTHDLVRLATSARVAIRDGELSVSASEACAAILDGYTSSIAEGGRPIVLAERHGWLRRLAVRELRSPQQFWAELVDLPDAPAPVPDRALRATLPPGATGVAFKRRVAGLGSLGRRRVVALADLGGALIAREAKATCPPSARWQDRDVRSAAASLGQAVRIADPFVSHDHEWQIRRLSPDCRKIDVGRLTAVRNEARALRAMGWETANLHLATRGVRLGRTLAQLPRRWLERASEAMVAAVIADWREWSAALESRRREPSRESSQRSKRAASAGGAIGQTSAGVAKSRRRTRATPS